MQEIRFANAVDLEHYALTYKASCGNVLLLGVCIVHRSCVIIPTGILRERFADAKVSVGRLCSHEFLPACLHWGRCSF